MHKLSPTSGLNLYQNCPRCFWLAYNKKIKRPDGIFPSLPGGIDRVLKKYFDKYRGELPPEIKGKVDGQLMPDLELMNKWRNWRTGLEYHDKAQDAVLFGALDDCLIDGDYYIPLDYKTRGSAPKEGASEKYYQTQLDTYNLMLNANGYKTKDYAYLLYYFPEKVETDKLIKFDIELVKIETDLRRIKKLFSDAVAVLKGPVPETSKECEYCKWLLRRHNYK